jgi:CubicO group peptidase (beta-lactamase class C family)
MAIAASHPRNTLASLGLILSALSLLPVVLAQKPAPTSTPVAATTPAPPHATAPVPASLAMDMNRLRDIRPRLQELVDRQQVPGVVYLVAHHGRIAAYDAVGMANIEAVMPMYKDSIFQIMSMTKNFTGVAAMMLVEEGKIDLKSPIEHYLPEFKDILVEEIAADGTVTIRPPTSKPTVWQLMDHTSGLAENPGGDLEDNPRTLRVPLAEAVKFYGTTRLKFEPGTRWSYSNMGIATLGRIIEVVSGQDYITFITDRLLKPLGMKDSSFVAPLEKRDRIALVYKHVDGKLVRSGSEVLAGDPAFYRAGAQYPAPEFGMYSTAADLFRFYQMLLNHGILDGHRYLSRQSVATMTQVFTPDVKPSGWMGGTGYGLTFEIVNQPEGTLLLHSPGTFGHGGAFGTEGWIDPKNDLIRIMLVQMSDGSAEIPRSIVMQMGAAAVLDSK